MKIKFLFLVFCMVTGFGCTQAPLVLQPLDYTENPVDVPNPDRGFVKSNDDHTADGPLVLPVSGNVAISQWTGNPWVMQYGPLTLGGVNPGRPVVTTNVWCEPGVVQFYIDLRHFSSRSRLNNTGTIVYGTTQPITDDALTVLREALLFVREKTNCTVHLRPAYDGMGWSYRDRYDTEPEGMCTVAGFEHLTWIEYHLLQLKPIFHEFEDIIMGIDSGTFGPWGEMHSSTMSQDPDAYAMLLNALLDAVPPSRTIITHAGAFMAWYNAKYGTSYRFANMENIPPPPPGSPEARFGMFNDSGSRGGTDGGSLSEGVTMFPNASRDDFDRDKTFNWIRNQNNIYGGEFGGGNYDPEQFYASPPAFLYDVAFCQITYLCAEWSGGRHRGFDAFTYTKDKIDVDMTFPHNGKIIRMIYDPVYEGKNALEYLRDRLGYRLVLREAKASKRVKQTGYLNFEGKIQNVGFGLIVNRKNVSVILKSKDGSAAYTALTNLDARDWRPDLDSRADNTAAWRDMNFTVNMSEFGNVPTGNYDIYLKINDPKEQSANKRCIRFANKGNSWNAELGANLIGSTTVR